METRKSVYKSLLWDLTTATHITKYSICTIFRKKVMWYGFGRFQNIVFWFFIAILNTTNSIDKTSFYLSIIKKKLNNRKNEIFIEINKTQSPHLQNNKSTIFHKLKRKK